MESQPYSVPAFEADMRKACDDGTIHGAVVVAKDRQGPLYANAFGISSLAPEMVHAPMTLDTVFLMASCTKLVTSIAALQCVERGLIDLDSDIEQVVPELARLEILDRFVDGHVPLTRTRQRPITLRHLLTHTSGLGYDIMTPKLMRYRYALDQVPGHGKTFLDRFGLPLLFEPGTSWCYGASIDWAGKIVERLSGRTLEEYFKQNIFQPLSITDITFFIDSRPDMKARLAGACIRDGDGSKIAHFEGPMLQQSTDQCFGGQGLFSTIPSYAAILQSLLLSDQKLLKTATLEMLFSPQLQNGPRHFLDKLRDIPEVWNTFPGEYPRDVKLDWGLGGMLIASSGSGYRNDSATTWSGYPNLFWIIDRKAGMCAIFGTQVLPPGDRATSKLITCFERAMYGIVRRDRFKL